MIRWGYWILIGNNWIYISTRMIYLMFLKVLKIQAMVVRLGNETSELYSCIFFRVPFSERIASHAAYARIVHRLSDLFCIFLLKQVCFYLLLLFGMLSSALASWSWSKFSLIADRMLCIYPWQLVISHHHQHNIKNTMFKVSRIALASLMTSCSLSALSFPHWQPCRLNSGVFSWLRCWTGYALVWKELILGQSGSHESFSCSQSHCTHVSSQTCFHLWPYRPYHFLYFLSKRPRLFNSKQRGYTCLQNWSSDWCWSYVPDVPWRHGPTETGTAAPAGLPWSRSSMQSTTAMTHTPCKANEVKSDYLITQSYAYAHAFVCLVFLSRK